MAYVDSSKIKVFPSTRRANYQLDSRQWTEANIVQIVNKLIDKPGFILTSEADFDLSSPFEFNIFGYYFNVDTASEITSQFSGTNPIYGHIVLDNTTNYVELSGQDDNGSYKGITFEQLSTVPTDDATNHYLALFEKNNGQWEVVPESRIRFNLSSILLEVDGGEIV